MGRSEEAGQGYHALERVIAILVRQRRQLPGALPRLPARHSPDQPPPLNREVPAARLSLMCPRAARRTQDPTLRAASHTPEVELAREKTVRVTGRATRPRTDEARIARTRGPMLGERNRGREVLVRGRINGFSIWFPGGSFLVDLEALQIEFQTAPISAEEIRF